MNVESIVKNVKSRAEPIIEQGQGAVMAGVETLKSANAIVKDSVQKLAQTQLHAGKDVLGAAQSSFQNAKSEAAAVVREAGAELRETLKHGYEAINAKLHGEPASHKEKAEMKKAAVKAKKAASREAAAEPASGGEGDDVPLH